MAHLLADNLTTPLEVSISPKLDDGRPRLQVMVKEWHVPHYIRLFQPTDANRDTISALVHAFRAGHEADVEGEFVRCFLWPGDSGVEVYFAFDDKFQMGPDTKFCGPVFEARFSCSPEKCLAFAQDLERELVEMSDHLQ